MGKSVCVVLIFIGLLFMQLKGSYSNHVSCFETERNALLKFRERLIDNTSRLSSWVGEDCCSWRGVSCSKKTGHVVKLDLRNRADYDKENFERTCLGGELSPSIHQLKHLHYLDLSMNDFSGTQIPKFLGSLETLIYLNVSRAQFEGKVPDHIGNLSSLQYLDFNTKFNSKLSIDDLWWVSKLPSLKYLGLSGVNLSLARTDWLHAINMLPSLSVLNLDSCELSNVPHLPHVNFTSLASLNLGDNSIQAVPEWVFNLSSLVHLNLDWNHLRSPDLYVFARLTSLATLSLIGDNFSTSMFSLCQLSNLVELHLGFNHFHDSVPSCIGNLTSLAILVLIGNGFQGSIPSELGNLTHLQVLDLSVNAFEHEIPMSMRNLCNLRVLDLSDNSFEGELSNLIGNSSSGCLKELEYLRLSSNSFWGPIPASLGGLPSLRVLHVGSNQLNGSIPSSLGKLSKLETLDISHNSFEGIIVECHFANLTRLKFLYGSTNKFIVLSVSTNWTPPFQLQEIDMGSWKVGPQFPLWLQTQRHVLSLNMSNGNISDTIPHWFETLFLKIKLVDLSCNDISGNLPRFSTSVPWSIIILKSNRFDGPLLFPSNFYLLDFSDNLLSGPIPAVSDYMSSSKSVLILANNNLHGQIQMICNWKSLAIIDLSNNAFLGTLPSCFGDILYLRVLDLSNNSLHGEIPSSLGSLLNLNSLHLHNNNFHGNLPTSLQNLTILVTLDLAGNGFEGAIPSWIGEKLSKLNFLSLHSNKFSGDIPPEICSLTSLQLLNLARNGITGKIPPCFGNFISMIEVPSTGYAFEYYFIEETNAYQENILASIRGTERQYTRTIPFLISIDLSNNEMVGEISKEIMDLSGLKALNLSGNYLNGTIPANFGNLKQLESLDLSRNRFSGPIPQSFSQLSFLSYLNLSFNNLSGHIPTGFQLQTLDDASIYMGNNFLCGAPLKHCPGEESSFDGYEKENGCSESKSVDDSSLTWFYSGISPGFFTGFIGVCALLHFKRSWRHACFQLVEHVYQKLYVTIAVKLNYLQRKFGQM